MTEETAVLRRRVDEEQQARFAEFGAMLHQTQATLSEYIKTMGSIQATQAATTERITAFMERFLLHDEREGQDRERIIDAITAITGELTDHKTKLARHDEQIATLSQWSLWLAAAIGALATGGVGWIISHLQVGMK